MPDIHTTCPVCGCPCIQHDSGEGTQSLTPRDATTAQYVGSQRMLTEAMGELSAVLAETPFEVHTPNGIIARFAWEQLALDWVQRAKLHGERWIVERNPSKAD